MVGQRTPNKHSGMGRRLSPTAPALTLLIGLLGARCPRPFAPTATPADGCIPLLRFHNSSVTCYRPARVRAAEDRFPLRPITPLVVVQRVAHLRRAIAL